jgi:hypothetical protein
MSDNSAAYHDEHHSDADSLFGSASEDEMTRPGSSSAQYTSPTTVKKHYDHNAAENEASDLEQQQDEDDDLFGSEPSEDERSASVKKVQEALSR